MPRALGATQILGPINTLFPARLNKRNQMHPFQQKPADKVAYGKDLPAVHYQFLSIKEVNSKKLFSFYMQVIVLVLLKKALHSSRMLKDPINLSN